MSNLRRSHQHLLRFILCLALCQTFFVLPSTARDTMPLAHPDQPAKPVATTSPIVPVSDEAQRARINASYGKLPLAFEANAGQTDGRVKFVARGAGYNLFLTENDAVLSLRKSVGDAKDTHLSSGSEPPAVAGGLKDFDRSLPQARLTRPPATAGGSDLLRQSSKSRAAVVRMKLSGANRAPQVVGEAEQAGKSNYFIGNDAAKWQTDVSHYGRVRYKEVYRGIDQVYYGNQGALEYDFIVAPEADYKRIRMKFEGARKVRIDAASGALILTTRDGGEIRQHAPKVYQETGGKAGGERREIAARYVTAGNRGEIGFELGGYDKTLPLVIDPTLQYSTYLGGSSFDQGIGIAVDTSGNAYVTGGTFSTNFPTQNPLQASSGGFDDAFVTKINAAGNGLVYSTYLGGRGDDRGNGIAVDTSGNAYVTGFTVSSNFPTKNPLQASNGGSFDAFVTKINAAGNGLVYSTYLGGSSDDQGNGIAVDTSGNAYVTGFTGSTNFPTQNPLQASNGGSFDAFVTKINAAGNGLVYSTYLGGSSDDRGNGIAVDTSGNAYVTGFTGSTNFPTQNPLQASSGGGTDAFVTKINAAGNGLVYSTYLGGNDFDQGNGIAVDTSGNAYVTGSTASTNFPTQNPLQASNGGSFDAFVTKINAAGNGLVYSTYLGGNDFDQGNGIAVDTSGNAYVTGFTDSTNFPTKNPLQATFGGSFDAFVTKLNATGDALVYSTYLGGSSDDRGNGIAVDTSGNAYVTGFTASTNFPTQNPLQASSGGGFDAFVLKISDAAAPPATYTISGAVKDTNGNNLKFILVTLSGTLAQSVRTDAAGNFTFSNVTGGGSYIITPVDSSLVFSPASQPLTNLSANQSNVNFTAAVPANPIPTPTPSDDFSGNQRDPTKFNFGSITQQPGAVDPNVTVVQQNGQLVITPVANTNGLHFNGYVSANSFDFTNGTASLEVVRAASGGAMSVFAIGSDVNNYFRFVTGNASGLTVFGIPRQSLVDVLRDAGIDAATVLDDNSPLADTTFLVFQVVQNGTPKTFSVSYDPVAQRFWQFRHDQTTMVPDTYPNGSIVFETSPDKVTFKVQFRASIQKPINALQTEISAGTATSVPAPGSAAYDNYQLTLNDIDNASFFVGQHYRDFLNRQPDISGLQFWTNEVFSCGADARCIDIKRQNVSAAYFLSREFQQTGFLVYKLYKASFGNIAGKPVPVRFSNFLPDVQAIGSGVVIGQPGADQKLEANKQAFISAFVNRPAFKAQYPDSLSNGQFVDQLNTNTSNSLSQAERDALVNGLTAGTETRATVLRKVAETQAFTDKEFNQAFVLMQYFGYLRRDPDSAPDSDFGGYFFWLNKLTSFNGDYIRSEMVRSFTISTEYRKRFGKP